jgi:hypothetical protein
MKRVSTFRGQKVEILDVIAGVGFKVLMAAVLLAYNAV